MKNKLKYSSKIIIYFLFIISFTISCKDESYELQSYDDFTFTDARVDFTEHYYTDNNDGTVTLETTVSVPNDISIIDYGHCWITTNNRNPTINDSKTSFGSISSSNFIIRSTISDYRSWIRYYDRAYITTKEGIIYDKNYYFPSN